MNKVYIRSLETIENDTTKSWFGADKDILLNKIYIMINIADALLYKNNVTYARRWANGALNTVMGASHAAELKEPHAAALVCMGSVHEVVSFLDLYVHHHSNHNIFELKEILRIRGS